MTTTYTVPTNPSDPELAALELIVRLPAMLLGSDTFTTVLQDFCGLLHAEGAFAGLSWADARQIASAVGFDACHDDAAEVIRNRARNVLAGSPAATATA
jgi:hypothetical protein